MKTIHNNPFRVAGILSNASAKEMLRQKAKINSYTKVGKELTFDVDNYSMLNSVSTTENSISQLLTPVL